MTKVRLSVLAEQDLLDIALYIAEDSPDRAVSFVGELQEACNGLAEHPLRFPIIPGLEARGHRRRVHGRYAVVYRVEVDIVRVLRIVSSAMDMMQVIDGD